MSNFRQNIEAFCDDINLITEDINDLETVDNIVCKFEKVSGAILSRNQKCKVIGFCRWKSKHNWPLAYLKSATEVKVFGIIIENSVKNLIMRNWESRFSKLQATLISWSSRVLDTIIQRVDVVKIYAFSRIYYIASVLPLSKTMRERIDKLVGKFTWSMSGKILRVSRQDLCKVTLEGGLNLTCLDSMTKAFRSSQLLRLLKNGDSKSIGHINFWIGEILEDFIPISDGEKVNHAM